MKLLVLLLPSVLLAATGRMAAAAVCPAPLRPQTRMFQKLSLDDVLVTRPVQSEASAPSDLDCGRRCAGREDCAMFTFTVSSTDKEDQTGQCRLYGQLQPNATEGQQSSPGARSYALNGVEKPCDNGYSRECGRCLRPVMTTNTYVQARDYCQTLDKGHLVGIKTLEELDCVMCLMKAKGLTAFWIWVGADDLTKEGSYVWWDGSPLAGRGSPLWAPREPSEASSFEDCVCARSTIDRGLHDNICSYSKYFVCERDLQ